MMKKTYQKPAMRVVELEQCEALLQGSGEKRPGEADTQDYDWTNEDEE